MIFALYSERLLQSEVQVAACRYYEQERHLVATSADFTDWVQDLPAPQRILCQGAGLRAAEQNLSFRRYLLERHGFSLYEYLTAHLSPQALHYWAHRCQAWGTALNPNHEWPQVPRRIDALP